MVNRRECEPEENERPVADLSLKKERKTVLVDGLGF